MIFDNLITIFRTISSTLSRFLFQYDYFCFSISSEFQFERSTFTQRSISCVPLPESEGEAALSGSV